jgi:hypothetical protein
MNATSTIVEVTTWYCQHCHEPIPDNMNRSTHETRCASNPMNDKNRIDMRATNGKTKNREEHSSPVCIAVNIDRATRHAMEDYIPRCFQSTSELIRSALLDTMLHPDDEIDVKTEGRVGEHATVVTITNTQNIRDAVRGEGNHSAYIRAVLRRYLVKLESLMKTT